jgi:2-aminoadipate transaminase
MLNALAATMPPGCGWTKPGGGFFVWLRMPEGIDSKVMLPRAVSSRVAYVPGTGFYADGSGTEYARLSYSLPDSAQITEGVWRLAGVIGEELTLRAEFGSVLRRDG